MPYVPRYKHTKKVGTYVHTLLTCLSRRFVPFRPSRVAVPTQPAMRARTPPLVIPNPPPRPAAPRKTKRQKGTRESEFVVVASRTRWNRVGGCEGTEKSRGGTFPPSDSLARVQWAVDGPRRATVGGGGRRWALWAPCGLVLVVEISFSPFRLAGEYSSVLV